jgi:hypothetical protein
MLKVPAASVHWDTGAPTPRVPQSQQPARLVRLEQALGSLRQKTALLALMDSCALQ